MNKGKIIIIDDSALVRNYLSKMITNTPELELSSTAANGEIGFQKILSIKPDVIILDLEMDQGDGLYVLQQIEEHLSFSERPFVLIHSTRAKGHDPMFKKAIEFGFCDFILKTEGPIEELNEKLKEAFLPKIILGIEAKKTRELLHTGNSSKQHLTINKKEYLISEKAKYPVAEGLDNLPLVLAKKKIHPEILILGASTGGPQVIRQIVQALDENIKIPIVVIQHMPETFTKSFAQELESASGIRSYELKHNMPLEKGKIHIFPGGMHGKLQAFGSLFIYYAERKEYREHPFKPSINLALEYLLESFNGTAICAILSGMGSDGTIGVKKLHEKGSLIFAQDQESSAVWGMPGSVVREHAADLILSLDDIGIAIQQTLRHYGI